MTKLNLYCDFCNRKYHAADEKNFIQQIKSQIQKSFKIAVDQEQIKQEAFMSQKPTYKCPRCGYLMRNIVKNEK
jgi:rubrerythrin